MKKIICLMLICLMGGMMAAQAAPKKTMSVIVVGKVSEKVKQIVSAAMMQRLSINKKYTVFERNGALLKAVEKEHDYQLSGKVPESQIRSLAKRMGADFVAAVNVVELPSSNRVMITGSIVNIETGETLKTCTETREIEDDDTLRAIANNVAYRLFSQD